ncbi:MFS transporter [Microbispora rosea subsp. aerata]|nr:MFS transporter [Microbispora rosea]GGO00853.1 MFS transporter [Microbispora rosea subsp. aerata]GIH56458.1 MFS transporter [Microbispora rosea subsp. aerata]GLJ84375.1 MFS transporter [Microbispora rosea subsp. aerata]
MPSPSTRQSWLPLIVLATGVSMVIVDATIVNVAVPAIIADLRLGATDVEWVNSIYSLMFAALLIPFGRAGDRYGRRRLFALGVAVFLLASVLAATSVSGPMLIAVRAVQGAGAAMAVPMTLAIINRVYVGRQRVIAFAVWGSIIGGMAAVGPLAGGWLVTEYGWRAAFWINLPIGALLLLGSLRVPESRDGHAAGGDLLGLVLAVLGTTGVVFALIEGQKYGWWEPRRVADVFGLRFEAVSPVPFALAVGVLALAALVVRERARERAGRPVLVNLTLFELPSFRYGSMAAVIVALGEFGMILVLPLFLQSALGYTAFRAGLVIAALALGTFLAGGMVPPLSKTLSPRAIVRIGLALEAAGAAGIGLSLSADMGPWRPVPWLFLYGAGIGFATAQLTGVLMADVPAHLSGGASALQSTVRQLGAALGVAILGGVLVAGLGSAVERGLADRPEQIRTGVARAVEESAGAAIPSLRDPAIHAVAVDAAAEATRRVTFITALALLAGVGVTLLLPRTPAAKAESPEPVAAGGPDTGGRDPDL